MKWLTSPHIQLLQSNRNILWAFIGMLISRLGDGVYSVALIAAAYGITQSGGGTGIVLASFAIANFIFGALSGVVSDKSNRKSVLIWSSLACGSIVTFMAILAYNGSLNIASLSVLSFLLGSATQFFEPTVNALIPQLVKKEQLTTANATIGMTDSIGYLAGPAVGGLLLTMLNLETVLLINAISFFIAMCTGMFLKPKIDSEKQKTTGRFLSEVTAGFKFVAKDRDIMRLFLAGSISVLAYSPFFVILPVFLDKDLTLPFQQQSALIGFIYSALALGQFVGYWVITYLRMATYLHLVLGYVLQAIGFGMLAIVNQQYLIIVFVFIAGISFGIGGSAFHSKMQSETPNHLLGRVYGVNYTLKGVISPVGRSVSGFMSDGMGGRMIFVLMSVMFMMSAVLSLAMKPKDQKNQKGISQSS
ncbi:MFS transporter [Paenibacillus xylanexedens]|uniref:MFS transporter n=1 Tax=Paenibacillus xylanexedens TaxID=528191 RepID=UPI0011A7D084|nr:MFS transporter [Paenibacillus xylanexedens]